MWRLAQRLDIEGRAKLSDTIGWWICLALAALALWGAGTNGAHANPVIEAKSMAHGMAPHRPLIWATASAVLDVARDAWNDPRTSLPVSNAAPGRRSGTRAAGTSGPILGGSISIATTSRALRQKIDPVFAAAHTWVSMAVCDPDRSDCRHGPERSWQSILENVAGLDRAAATTQINRSVNTRIVYRSDQTMHGTDDQWSGPIETMQRNEGDCEDLAILKMWLLARAGVPLANMYILVVRSPRMDTAHAVLLVGIGEDFLVLDNLSDEPRPSRDVTDYEPIFSVNAFGMWLHIPADTRVALVR